MWKSRERLRPTLPNLCLSSVWSVCLLCLRSGSQYSPQLPLVCCFLTLWKVLACLFRFRVRVTVCLYCEFWMMLFVKLIKGNKLITFVLDYQSWSLFTLTDIFPVSFQAARERDGRWGRKDLDMWRSFELFEYCDKQDIRFWMWLLKKKSRW